MSSSHKTAAGFTLIEVIIAVVIVSILAAIAIPSYRTYLLRNNRATAKRVITELISKEEAFFLNRRAYASDFTSLIGVASSTATEVFLDRTGKYTANQTDNGVVYKLTLSPNTPSTGIFTLVADAVNSQTKDTACLKLGQQSNGTRTDGSDDCWER